jgi:hypothetical protein
MIAMSRWTGFLEEIQIMGLESDSAQDFVYCVASTARGVQWPQQRSNIILLVQEHFIGLFNGTLLAAYTTRK